MISVPAPETSFASDNTAGIHPVVMQALVDANVGTATGYGADPWTEAAVDRFAEVFGRRVDVFFCFGGTGGNVVGLQALLRPWEGVVCADSAHINTDECGAPERFLGAKLIDIATEDGKLQPGQIAPLLGGVGDQHHVQPRVVSITQSTEWGTVYSADEVAALADEAHRHDLYLHMDGARFANGVAAAGSSAAAMAVETGVDVLTFGGTKCGTAYGEAVVVFRPELAGPVPFLRKQAGQLASKMRFISAQFDALLAEDRWLGLGGHANAMAAELARRVDAVDGVELTRPPEANAVFARLAPAAVTMLQEWSFFWVWDPLAHEVRWMTSWATTTTDLDRFVAGVAEAAAAARI